MKKIIVSIVSAGLFKFVFFPIEHFLEPDLILISVLIFILWKGNFMVDHYLNNKYSWVKNPHKRLRIQVIVSFLFTSVFLFIFMYTLHQIRFGDGRIVNPRMIQLFPISLTLTFCVLTIHIGKQFYDALKNSLLEIEKYKTESAIAQLQNLKNQLNPHFLFNKLSVLTSLVYKNQDKAAQFINELAKVYFLFTIYFKFLMKLIFLQLLSLQFDKLKNIILVVCLQSVKSKKKSYSEE